MVQLIIDSDVILALTSPAAALGRSAADARLGSGDWRGGGVPAHDSSFYVAVAAASAAVAAAAAVVSPTAAVNLR